MQVFILKQNAERFRARLAETTDPERHEQLRAMLAAVERELALVAAERGGAGAPPWPIGAEAWMSASRERLIAAFRKQHQDAPQLAYLIDPGPGLRFVAVNAAFERALDLREAAVVGQPLFTLFPDNPQDAHADGAWLLYVSMRQVAETLQPHAMPPVRYDVRDATGAFVERHWQIVNGPVFDADGRLVLLQLLAEERPRQAPGAETLSAA